MRTATSVCGVGGDVGDRLARSMPGSALGPTTVALEAGISSRTLLPEDVLDIAAQPIVGVAKTRAVL